MINSKLPGIGQSIFAVMTKMANDFSAINLSQGFPDFNCDEQLIELVRKYALQGFNQYAPMPGVLKLREAISQKTKRFYGFTADPDKHITVAAGATQALFTAITAIVERGDEVIIFEPAYDSYLPAILLSGGIPVPIELNENDFSYDWDLVKSKINSRTKLVIVNSPHNPSGYMFTENDMAQLCEIAENNDLLFISDEVYEHITFDGRKHLSFLSYPQLSAKSMVISSFGKTYHTTGWKMGYVIANEILTAEFRKVHQFNVFAVNTPIQYAYADFLADDIHPNALPGFYEKKRNYFIDELKGSAFDLTPASGTYFQLLDYTKIIKKDDFLFAETLVKDGGVSVIPLSPFYSQKGKSRYIRICFAKTEKILKTAAEKLREYSLKR